MSLPTTDDSQHQPKNFFEDSNEAVIFVDNTCVTVIGKVVGGSVEAAKDAGFERMVSNAINKTRVVILKQLTLAETILSSNLP
jgi:hypothetical protein